MLRYSPAMERAAAREVNLISVVHQHALWTGISRVTNQLRHRGIPTIIAPHSSLDKWAVKKSWWKKRIALQMFEWNNLRTAFCLHACSAKEIAGFRDFGLKNPIAVIPNGISDSWLKCEGIAANFRKQFNVSADRRVLLFLSRVTPKKGLPMLLEAFSENREKFSDWILVIAGADEFGHLIAVKDIIEKKGLQQSVIVVGPLHGQIKRDAFSAAELFVLPSYSEGAPIVI